MEKDDDTKNNSKHVKSVFSCNQCPKRFTAQSSVKLRSSADMDYLENTCQPHQEGVCEFKPVLGALLKTVDSVHNNVASIGDCQKLCRAKTDYHCVSYDYAHTGSGVCRLSHHTFRTLSHIQDPLLLANKSVTYTLDNCYNLSVTCHHHSMLATVTSNRVFSGKIYTKSRYAFLRIDFMTPSSQLHSALQATFLCF